jgi:hypothetical protein
VGQAQVAVGDAIAVQRGHLVPDVAQHGRVELLGWQLGREHPVRGGLQQADGAVRGGHDGLHGGHPGARVRRCPLSERFVLDAALHGVVGPVGDPPAQPGRTPQLLQQHLVAVVRRAHPHLERAAPHQVDPVHQRAVAGKLLDAGGVAHRAQHGDELGRLGVEAFGAEGQERH